MAEGLYNDNRLVRRTEPLITVEQLKKKYLFDVDFRDTNGREFGDEDLQELIEEAVSALEHRLDISIFQREFSGDEAEEKDYHANDYIQWGYFQLNNYPVIQVDNVRAVYPNANILSYPKDWYKLQKHDGILRLIPTAGSLAQFAVDQGGHYFPEVFRHEGIVPLVWQIDYKAGFEDGKIPKIMNRAIGLLASIHLLNILGDSVVGAGLAGQTLSIDGLSQSVTTTASAEFHAYSARVKEFYKELFGSSKEGPNRGVIRDLENYYQGSERMHIL